MTSFKIAGLEVTVHGRQFPDSNDYWDGNWLYVSARCDGPGSYASASGSFLRVPELAAWLVALKQMSKTLSGKADLETTEPNLALKMVINKLGQIDLSVSITPDHLTQDHRFDFEIDQSYLAPLIQQLEAVLKEFPMTGKPRD